MDAVWVGLKGKPRPYGRMLKEAGWLDAHKEDMLFLGDLQGSSSLPEEYHAYNWFAEKNKSREEQVNAVKPPIRWGVVYAGEFCQPSMILGMSWRR